MCVVAKWHAMYGNIKIGLWVVTKCTVSALFFVKGVKYVGANFSLIDNHDSAITFIGKFNDEDVAIYTILRHILINNWAGLQGKNHDIESFEGVRAEIISELNGAGDGIWIQIVTDVFANVALIDEYCVGDGKQELQVDCIGPDSGLSNSVYKIFYRDRELYSCGLADADLSEFVLPIAENKFGKVLSRIVLNASSVFSIEKKFSCISVEYFGKQVYVLCPSMNCEGHSVHKLNDAMDVCRMCEGNDAGEFVDGNLLSQTLGYKTKTPYIKFLSAWIVLEKCVEKYFAALDKKYVFQISVDNVVRMNDRTRTYLSDFNLEYNEDFDKYKFNMGDKFVVCCCARNIEDVDLLVKKFAETKKIRNKLHKYVSESSDYPVQQVLDVLRLFVNRKMGIVN